jgi:hypothetical protein
VDPKEIVRLLDNMLDILATNKLVTDEHVAAVTAVEKLIESEHAAWDMLDELKSSEDFGAAFGDFVKELMGSTEVAEG